MSSSVDPEEMGQEQPFVSHLVELRDRLIRMVIAVLLTFLALFPFANDIYRYVAAPLMAQLPKGTSMIATEVASPFLTPFKLSLVAGVFVSMPYLLYQLWSFVAPGLYKHEKRLAIPLLVSSILLFYLGMLFAYYVVFPLAFAFLTGSAPQGVAVMTDITHYLDFVLTLFFAFGIAFEIPIATILLVAAGITTPQDLRTKRPYVIVGVFVAGMLLTPPDVISQTLLALPMWLLFELGIFFSTLFQRRRAASKQAREAADASVTSANAAVDTQGSNRGASSPGGSGEYGASASADSAPTREPIGRDLDAELDAIEAEEEIDSQELDEPDSVDQKLRQIKALREADNDVAARRLLYEVLEEGDEGQRYVARNILSQLDSD